MTVAAVGLLALVIANPTPCLLRDPSVHAPPPILGAFRDARVTDVCPPERVRASKSAETVPSPGTHAARRGVATRARTTVAGRGQASASGGCWSEGRGPRSVEPGGGPPASTRWPSLAVRGGPNLREVLENRLDGVTATAPRRTAHPPRAALQSGRLRDGTGGLHPWSSAFAPGMDLSAWIGRSIQVGWLRSEGRWWASFEGGWLGWYEDEGLASPFPVAGAAQWFGEVFFGGPRPALDMGNGRHATAVDAARFPCALHGGARRGAVPCSAHSLAPADRPRRVRPRGRGGGSRRRGPGEPAARPRPPPSSASEGTPSARETSAPSRPH